MNRLFLDANVLFSIAYGSASLEVFWKIGRQRQCRLLASAYVIEEAIRNLSSPGQFKRLKDLLAEVEIVPDADPKIPCPVILPEKDRPVLLAAVQARATHFISGDLQHFNAYRGQIIQGVLICTPRDYLQNIRQP
ncbi:MAG TPA: DNA-binding protein [Desulfotomaculum sp.]|nr:DNA-binding protein [Desulfotomaculum sp.]